VYSHAPQSTLEHSIDQALLRRRSRCRVWSGIFDPPSDCCAEAFVEPLETFEFPERAREQYEAMFAINEGGYASIAGLPAWPKLYASTLDLACNARHSWGIEAESDYHYIVLADEVESGGSERGPLFADFLEWLFDLSPKAEFLEDRYLLLSWVLLQRLIGRAAEPLFARVMEVLISNSSVCEPTVSKQGKQAWLDLHARIPLRYRFPSTDYEVIIAQVYPG
jgi:hypothetical protein